MLQIVRLGSPRAKGERLRIGAARRPPRGVKKKDYARLDFYDVWLPELFARLSHQANFSLGCYCEDESRCHRSILRELLKEHGARIAK